MVDERMVIYRLFFICYRHSAQMSFGMFSGKCHPVIVASRAVMKGNTVNKDVRFFSLIYKSRGYPVSVQ